jgi:hypothetical protein
MIMFAGLVVLHENKEKVVAYAFGPNDNFPLGRCALMCNGRMEWHDTRKLDAMLVDRFPLYVEVSQHNYKEKKEHGGHSIYHKAPKDMFEAMTWAIEMGGIKFSDVEQCGWGHGLYKVNENGTLEFMYGDWDSSG